MLENGLMFCLPGTCVCFCGAGIHSSLYLSLDVLCCPPSGGPLGLMDCFPGGKY